MRSTFREWPWQPSRLMLLLNLFLARTFPTFQLIDGVKKSLDDQAYLQRITPRKARSSWLKMNTEYVERLIAEGRMEEPGLVSVRAAKADGRWEDAYPPPSKAEVLPDFVVALADRPKAKRFFQTLNKSSPYAITYGLTTAKRAKNRQRKFEKFHLYA